VLEKLSSIVRSVSVADDGPKTSLERERDDKEPVSTAQYDSYGGRPGTMSRQSSVVTQELRGESRSEMRGSSLRHGAARAVPHESGHWRNDSNISGGDYSEPTQPIPAATVRRNDYDAQSMESELNARRPPVVNPIPPPTVTVKSEFPTISRSKDQQSLTCLVTLDVSEKGWRSYDDDITPVPLLAQPYDQQYPPSSPTGRSQYSFDKSDGSSARQREREAEREREQEILVGITEELRQRVENWHGLDFNR
jgi:hypothetical protein